MATPISRRTLLRAGGATALSALLASCSSSEDELLTVIIPTFEVLTGPAGRVPMGILGEDNRPILDAAPEVTITREGETIVSGAMPLYYGEGLGDRGIYVLETDLPRGGIHDVVVRVPGRGTGQGVFAAVTPENAQVHAPGQPFPPLETPTTADPGPLETLCTQDPPCTMHEVSLDEAMAAGPVVFTVATPQYCQTAVCGPVVSVVEQVRDDVGRGDVTYVHVEVFSDAGQTLTPTVGELGLPTEPWTWVIAGDGTVVDRFDGPVVPSLLAESVRAL